VTQNSKTGAAFIAGGTIAGAGVSTTVGAMELAGGIGATPVVAAGAVAGAAAYGAINAIAQGDATAFATMGIGAVGSAGVYSIVGGNGGSIKIWSQIPSFDKFNLDPVLSGECWEVLGVNQSDRPKDVKLAYLRLARLYHPDVNGSGVAKASMQAINQAYKEFQERVI
jgi:hypothetical protein